MPRLYSLRLRPIRRAQPIQRAPAPVAPPVPEPVTPEPETPTITTGDFRSGLFRMSKDDLIDLAVVRGIDPTGTRAEILGRLAHSDG